MISGAKRPLFLLGSQALLEPAHTEELAAAIEALQVPIYLSGMARGLMGPGHPLHFRHCRREALREADLVLLAGLPCDFRLDYGRHIPARARLVRVDRSHAATIQNRRPTRAVVADPGLFLRRLAKWVQPAESAHSQAGWRDELRRRDDDREKVIAEWATEEVEQLNPVAFCRQLEEAIGDDGIQIADGGDFVATASYITSPRRPLAWLDPGVFGTLGVGAGFAIAAKLLRPESEVWLLYGDGSAGYSLAEFDTFVRHGLPVIAVVGNDGSWEQIAREQVEVLGDAVGTELRQSDYHRVVAGFGARGMSVEDPGEVAAVLQRAKTLAAGGEPVLINALLGKSDFRKGSISL